MNSDFKELLAYLNQEKVKYLIVGGYAVSYYAEPRYTKDLDIWVEPTSINSKKLIQALSKFGAPIEQFALDEFAHPGVIFIFGIAPNRIYILTKVQGTTFAHAWSNKHQVKFEDLKINFISKNDLKKSKKAAGRPQDLIDLENLKGKLDS